MQLVTCKAKPAKKKGGKPVQKCTTKVVTGTVTFTTSGKAKVSSATLLRGKKSYRVTVALRHGNARILTTQVLREGRYRLVVGRQVTPVRIG